jgi:hypothetical protein
MRGSSRLLAAFAAAFVLLAGAPIVSFLVVRDPSAMIGSRD